MIVAWPFSASAHIPGILCQNSPRGERAFTRSPSPSVLILRAVRTRAKSVALKVTVPSLLRGMFMPTSLCEGEVGFADALLSGPAHQVLLTQCGVGRRGCKDCSVGILRSAGTDLESAVGPRMSAMAPV